MNHKLVAIQNTNQNKNISAKFQISRMKLLITHYYVLAIWGKLNTIWHIVFIPIPVFAIVWYHYHGNKVNIINKFFAHIRLHQQHFYNEDRLELFLIRH